MIETTRQTARLICAFTALLALIASGCSTVGSGGGAVGEIHLFGVPVALNLDGGARASGIGVRVYASARDGSHGLAIRRGRLDILMFDDASTSLDPRAEKPLKVWSFGPAELEPFRARTFIGEGYQLALNWESSRPKGKVVTVVARYHLSGRGDVYSSPNAVSIAPH